MKFAARIAILFAVAFFFHSCEEEPQTGNVKVTFNLTKDGQSVEMDEVFATDSVDAVRIERLRFYISDLNMSGHGQLKDVQIVDFEDNRTSFTFEGLDAKSYGNLTFLVGLNEEQNASNPIDFSTGHPLSASWAMYWSWAMKYRFIIMEGWGAPDGTIDASADDFQIVLHPGMDGFEQLVDAGTVTVRAGSTTQVVVNIDVDDMFDGPGGYMDLKTENTSHTTPTDRDIALKFITNFAAAMSRK